MSTLIQEYPSEHDAWINMSQRCYNSNNPYYHNYGGRGIKICPRWLSSFKNFLEDMGPKPGHEYTLERKDNDGNYEPGNCIWATRLDQSLNKRMKLSQQDVDDIRRTFKENIYNQNELARLYDVSQSYISDIIRLKSWRVK
jgi:predicted XRE-type DNA-binding protein